MNSQHSNTNSKGDYVLKKMFVLKISGIKNKSESKIYIILYKILCTFSLQVEHIELIKFFIISLKNNVTIGLRDNEISATSYSSIFIYFPSLMKLSMNDNI